MTSVFKYIPLSNDEATTSLRVAGVQHIIWSKICELLRDPFLSDNLPSGQTEMRLLNHLSAILSDNPRMEKLWRSYTLKGLSSLPERLNMDQIAEQATKSILELVSPILKSHSSDLHGSLSAIFNHALSLWTDIRRDGSKLLLSDKPVLTEGWISVGERTGLVPQNSQPLNEDAVSFCLFPLIRISNEKQSGVLHEGRALFSDSDVYVQVADLKSAMERAAHEGKRRALNEFQARNSVPSSPLQARARPNWVPTPSG